MTAVVIDTNVLHVANQNSQQAGLDCIQRVVERLERVRENELVCLDRDGFILQEYFRQRFQFSGRPGLGDELFRWVFQNQANPTVCEMVEITSIDESGTAFQEFPDDPQLAQFDLSDRKFVAVALNSNHAPPVLNAVDSDWWDFRNALTANGVQIEFICPHQFED